ncbi:MAG: hypothetical protein Q8K94_01210, partial [Moraxellaceae bacterium]|nr:hypothetical protein [Moraxellaceae bacterium]
MNSSNLIRPILKAIAEIKLSTVLRHLGAPLLGLAVFLMIWQFASQRIDTSLGTFPGPLEVVEQAG